MTTIFAPNTVDLTAPSTSIGTTTPPAIVAATLFRSANSGNVDFVAQPSGTGAFQLQQTDSTTTGGNARGANAIDLQTLRVLASQVASGAGSFAAGVRNTSSGVNSFAVGTSNIASGSICVALGTNNNASGQNSIAIGASNISSSNSSVALGGFSTANGLFSIALGATSSTKAVSSLLVLGTNFHSGLAKSQTNILCLTSETTDATPIVLRSASAVASATNQLVLQNNSALYVEGLVIANVTDAGNTSSWKIAATIKRGANAASTALVGTPTITMAHQDAGASGWVVAVTADTTNGCLAVTVTGQAATTIRWTCTLFASEAAF